MSESLFAAQGFWDEVTDVDDWLDGDWPESEYHAQPLAQDWAQGIDHAARDLMLDELADAALTAILAIQHFTKDAETTSGFVSRRMTRIWNRMSAS